jgi:hypothetical protein
MKRPAKSFYEKTDGRRRIVSLQILSEDSKHGQLETVPGARDAQTRPLHH